ncbi:MAG: (Fe-S)-binding protein [Deltaproteobacteria bacterium]|nr:(Fe-S)-binding protein [Deltaproteobacteria bacterium]
MKSPDQATSLCHSCPKLCRYACPVAETDQNEATTPWGKMSAMKLSENGILPFNRETASLAYKCLDCKASEGACELDNPVPETLFHYRAKAFAAKVAPPSILTYAEQFQKFSNPFGIDLQKKMKSLLPREFSTPLKKIAYFPGCSEIQHFPKSTAHALVLLRKCRIDLELFHEPILCCGYPLYAAGDIENFREIAEINIHAFQKYREVIVGSPTCLQTIDVTYRQLGFRFSTRFYHVVEKIKISPTSLHPLPELRTGQRIAYHDPCHLGRARGIYDPPRQFIKAATGVEPVEFFTNRANSSCCGAGGLLPISSPDTARQITMNRIEEFKRTGASVLVTASPECACRFKAIDPKIKVMGLLDLLS